MGASLTEEEEGVKSKRRSREGVINGQDVTIPFRCNERRVRLVMPIGVILVFIEIDAGLNRVWRFIPLCTKGPIGNYSLASLRFVLRLPT
jgi:hypothetical protein